MFVIQGEVTDFGNILCCLVRFGNAAAVYLQLLISEQNCFLEYKIEEIRHKQSEFG